MIASLKALGKTALGTYPNTERTEWSKLYPGQIVLCISQIFWTTEVEQAIKDYEQNGLEEYIKVCQS
jgi:dynein heavy chain